MAGDSVKVDFGQVTQLGSVIDGQAKQIDGYLGDLKQQISNLDQLWAGAASSGYQQTKNAWFQAADDMQQTLAGIATAVHAAADSYTQTGHGNAQLWG